MLLQDGAPPHGVHGESLGHAHLPPPGAGETDEPAPPGAPRGGESCCGELEAMAWARPVLPLPAPSAPEGGTPLPGWAAAPGRPPMGSSGSPVRAAAPRIGRGPQWATSHTPCGLRAPPIPS
ncbi:MAG: hypothetical protein Kow0092_07000 [Deferrisomatales bacterium]